MLWKDAISRLFGFTSDDDGGQEEPIVEEQKEEQAETVSAPAQELDPACLNLDSQHSIYQLWRLREEQAGHLAVPVLRLEGFPERREILSDSALKHELAQLRMFVTSTADARLKKAQPWEEKKGEGEEEEVEMVFPDLDASASIFTTRDETFAWILVYPPVGKGKEIDIDILRETAVRRGITYGIEKSALESIPTNPNRYFYLIPIAEGTPAVPGQDGYVVDKFPRSKQKEIRVDEYDHVDYSELHLVHNAEEGDVICEIIPPTPAVPGRTVTNREIPAKDGKAVTAPKGRNTSLTEDGKLLIAEKAGHVEFDGRNFQVKPVLDVGKNVDYSTGNINFLGDVHIHGDICSGFTVRANGNITVDGVVEASSIEAGGDLVVVKGIKGDGHAVINVSRNMYAKYLESTIVCVKESLQTDNIINSDVYCDGVVKVDTGRGIIIGGSIHAASEVRANIVGSRSESDTYIHLGGIPSADFEYENLIREIEELEEEYEDIERQPDNPAKTRTLPMVRMKLSVNKAKLRQLTQEMEKPKEERQEEGYRRLVCGIVYPGTEISIDDVSLCVEHETQSCTATLTEEGEIRLQ
ncbi:MAG: DUF342 domain-containing protein [Coprococcus sp.]|nr:DUF342 domain-containing protein [Coprococcus sp.]